MPIICFEGPSAVGKTTTAQALKANCGAFVVPEVNQLFDRSEAETAEWYVERQVDRWSIAVEHRASHPLIILDGDPFQPLWYNWAYDFVGWQGLDFLEEFYKAKVQTKALGFPDLYILFSTSEDELRNRRTRDTTRSRAGFEHHLKIIKPQHRYFQAMQTVSPNRVLFFQAESVEQNTELVQRHTFNVVEQTESYAVTLLDQMVQWLRNHRASC